MRKLIITANPSSKGFTHTIANELSRLSKERGDTVEILDLYKTELQQGFLTYENMKDIPQDSTTRSLQEKISGADELVFVFPIWWGDMPAIMKNFWDCNFTAGFAFRYENGKSVGLLTGKSARIIATSGAPSFFYTVILHIQLLWNLNRIKFCGIKQKSCTVFGDMSSPKTDRSRLVESISKLV